MTPEQLARRKKLLSLMHELSLEAAVYDGIERVSRSDGNIAQADEMAQKASAARRALLPVVTEYQKLVYAD